MLYSNEVWNGEGRPTSNHSLSLLKSKGMNFFEVFSNSLWEE